MATIKMCTDIPQSKKLADILPLESADKHWIILDGAILRATVYDYFDLQEYNQDNGTFREYIPCWSLAALLRIIREKIGYTLYGVDVNNVYMSCNFFSNKPLELETELYDNEVDVCYEMIVKLHEQNLL